MDFSRAALVSGLALALATAGCGSADQAGPAATPGQAATVSVVASTDVYGAVASAVGGSHVKVTSVIHTPDADPHEYENTPADVVAVGESKVLVTNGGGYDGFADKLAEAASRKPAVIDAVALSGLTPGPAPAEPTPEGAQEASHEEHAEGFNEHVWYHLPTVAKVADALAGELAKADPPNAGAYQANAAAFRGKLDGLTAKLNAIKAAHQGTKVAVTEPVAGYLIDAAGLTNVTPAEFSEAIEEGNDPPAAVLNQAMEVFQGAEPARALLLNAQTESAATKQVEDAAGKAGVPVVKVTETLPAGIVDYVQWMGGQIDQLAGALDRK